MANKKDTSGAAISRQSIQSRIVAKYGEEAMKMAKERLCSHCFQERSCLLLPLCLDGSDCPYFRKSEVNNDA
jgi:hypothetical protein